MSENQDSLRFQYSGFLQNVDVQITAKKEAFGYRVTCSAKLKLPILKKNFATWTLFKDENLEWTEHSSVVEEGSQEKLVHREKFSPDAVDPIGFFLKIHRGEWTADKVKLVLGNREVQLDVLKEGDTVTIARPEKNQKLVIKLGSDGVQTLEVPIPVIGSLKIKRVK